MSLMLRKSIHDIFWSYRTRTETQDLQSKYFFIVINRRFAHGSKNRDRAFGKNRVEFHNQSTLNFFANSIGWVSDARDLTQHIVIERTSKVQNCLCIPV